MPQNNTSGKNMICGNCRIKLKYDKLAHKYGYGQVIKCCPNCGTPYAENGFAEAGLKGIDKDDRKLIKKRDICGFLSGVLMTVLLVLSVLYAPRIKIFLFLGPLLCVYSLFEIVKNIFNYKNRKKYLDEEIIRSQERLRNPEYLGLLKNFGQFESFKSN